VNHVVLIRRKKNHVGKKCERLKLSLRKKSTWNLVARGKKGRGKLEIQIAKNRQTVLFRAINKV